MPTRSPYVENFDDGPGGWVADTGIPLTVWDGVAHCYGPWTLDANHAPPGAGYLHLLMYLTTSRPAYSENLARTGGANRFLEEENSTDLRGAHLTVRCRGRIEPTGPLCNDSGFSPQWEAGEKPELLLLVQAKTPHAGPNWVLTGQPLVLADEWTEQTLILTEDESQWTFLGSRRERADVYGHAPIAEVLADVNLDLIFILFPLSFTPINPVEDMHRAWAVHDYAIDTQRLPKGVIMFDSVRIDYPD